MVNRNLICKLAGVASLALAASFVNAQTVLNPGSFVTSIPTGVPGGAFLNIEQNNYIATDFSSNVGFTGAVASAVVLDSTSGGLDFLYAFSNDGSSTTSVDRMTLTDFTGFTTSVGQYTSEFANGPDKVNRSTSGRIIGADYSQDLIAPGSGSNVLVIYTNAHAYTQGNAALIGDTYTANAEVFAPTAVPEPASMTVLGLGIAAIARRKRK